MDETKIIFFATGCDRSWFCSWATNQAGLTNQLRIVYTGWLSEKSSWLILAKIEDSPLGFFCYPVPQKSKINTSSELWHDEHTT